MRKLTQRYIINDAADYKLVAPYNSFWANNVVGTVESIFEISYSATYPNAHRNSWMPPELGGTRTWIPNNAFIALVTNPAIGGTRSTLIRQTDRRIVLWHHVLPQPGD